MHPPSRSSAAEPKKREREREREREEKKNKKGGQRMRLSRGGNIDGDFVAKVFARKIFSPPSARHYSSSGTWHLAQVELLHSNISLDILRNNRIT